MWSGRPCDGTPIRLPSSYRTSWVISIQCLHLCEEYLTGFQHEFPRLFGYQWSDQRFPAFNLIWLSIFVLAAVGVFLRFPLAYLVVFFYALVGGIGNGINHLLLTAAARRYLPGALTAPVALIVGAALLSRLLGGRRGQTKPPD